MSVTSRRRPGGEAERAMSGKEVRLCIYMIMHDQIKSLEIPVVHGHACNQQLSSSLLQQAMDPRIAPPIYRSPIAFPTEFPEHEQEMT